MSIIYSTLLKAYIASIRTSKGKAILSVDKDRNEAIAKALDRIQYITR